MFGEACCKVIKTRNGAFPVGTLVKSTSGWRTHFVSPDGKDLQPISFDLESLSPSVTLGVLGMPGMTAYFGLRLCEPKAGEVCVVNAAAGAVGSIVGQLAKIKLTKELNFDYAFNYKNIPITDALKRAAPNGVDVFFDNVGGDFFHEMLTKHMAQYGRVCICGSISNYNDKEKKKYPQLNMDIIMKELTLRGIYITTYIREFGAALAEMVPLVKKGDIKFKETVFDGFNKMPQAMANLVTNLTGQENGQVALETL
ncbi:unnamed protein product [Rotaria sordida]|uniref:Alcohol dehydrogenase-like C-terminal domain-containing protein n=1 Tax=Rotaria sordida TaxID=392033 RepID=A0A814YFR9_9BILA|nr:unnamed protein product [Rotaria sordida]